jgi:hypothetical protein
MFDIESVKEEWKLTDTDDATLGHYGKMIFAKLCQGKGVEEIAYDIWSEREVCFIRDGTDYEYETPFELEFERRFLAKARVGQWGAKQKEMN